MGSRGERNGTLQTARENGVGPKLETSPKTLGPRIVIATRIYSPEVAAAAFRLRALARELAKAGASVQVLTTTAPKSSGTESNSAGITVCRFPVLRDRGGNIRGYAQYLSFDIPLVFRLLFTRADVIVAEPPPTTGAVVALIAWLRRRPFVYYAADVWTDAVASTNAPKLVVTLMRKLETSVLRRANTLLAVSDSIAQRLQEFGATRIETVGNGVDTTVFTPESPPGDEIVSKINANPLFVYAGTMSEWQGAGVFLEAFALLKDSPSAEFHIFGQGTQLSAMRVAAAKLASRKIHFHGVVSAREIARWLRGATAALVSIQPDQGYDFAKPTKLYAAAACGTPVLFAGNGASRDLVNSEALGLAVPHSSTSVVKAMQQLAHEQMDGTTASLRATRARWALDHASLVAVGERGTKVILNIASKKTKDGRA